MITVLKSGTTVEQRDNLIEWFEDQGLKVHVSVGDTYTILGLVGDTSHIDVDMVNMLDIVDSVKRVSEPFKKANRKFHPEDTVIDVNGVKIGGGHFVTIAGPCSVENEEQIVEVAKRVKAAGADMLRGGAFKPRTSPYAFQGLKAEGIELLLEAKKVTGLPIVTEIMNEAYLDLYEDVDVIQVGARNMQNFDLLKALGEIDKPILLKRGLANTLEELLMSAESRNTYDLSAVPALHEMTHLPVIGDPSHATGKRNFVKPMALATAAAGADGVMIEVHNDPSRALSDGAQSLTPDQFDDVMKSLRAVRSTVFGGEVQA
ncbi:3-deoxy-7-phosphoheptulonate synthase [Eubacterium pyruvativorans]|uniref:3-deoxy-7-phosphoheptulonate synthase n=1 Tax=Eubacterium pyruvativorans TaxID=155865 RepID=UPI0013D23FFF|nr:3-deoxy-7-phosphoheptulonate synthase [Eubacterium pyruvativorans]